MTQPLITTITPQEGLATGRCVITVRGMHFNTLEPEAGPGEPTPTVSVTIGGLAAERVVQVARYRLDVVTPRYLGHPSTMPAAVDVVVTNLDGNGEPIPGESTTVAGGFTYRRPDLTAESSLDAVNRVFLRMLRSNLVDEVAPSTDPDWSRDPSSGLTAVSRLPCVLVDGPDIERSLRYRYATPQEEARGDSGEVALRDHPFTAKLSWSIVLVAERKHEAVRMLNAAIRLFDRRPYLRVPIAAGSSSFVEVDLWHDSWNADDRPADRVYTYTARVMLEPVYLDDDYGLANDGVPVDETTAQTTEGTDDVPTLEVESL